MVGRHAYFIYCIKRNLHTKIEAILFRLTLEYPLLEGFQIDWRSSIAQITMYETIKKIVRSTPVHGTFRIHPSDKLDFEFIFINNAQEIDMPPAPQTEAELTHSKR